MKTARKLYSGIIPPLLTIGSVSATNFAIYDNVRRVLFQRQLRKGDFEQEKYGNVSGPNYLTGDRLTNVFVASSVAGGTVSLGTSPFIVVKTTQQVMSEYTMREALKETWGFAGMRGFYVGYGAHFFCESIGR